MEKRTFLKKMATGTLVAGVAPSVILSACQPKKKKEERKAMPVVLELPKLPYAYNGLEPAIDTMTMEIHHSKHHAGYLKKFKKALGGKKVDNYSAFFKGNLSDGERNNGGGFYNHCLYWDSLTPGGKAPSKEFLEEINKNFGSLSDLKGKLFDGGKSVFGSGWVWLIKDASGKLQITTTPNQDNPLMSGVDMQGTPLLGIDVWEHAYYLKHQNQRGSYLDNVLEIVNWENVGSRA